MRAVFIYNPHNANELTMLDRVKQELLQFIDEVEIVDFMEAKHFHISQTPSLIVIREDLQGSNLLSENGDGKLLVTAELWKAIQEEEKAIHNIQDCNRIDNLIVREKTFSQDALVLELIEGGII